MKRVALILGAATLLVTGLFVATNAYAANLLSNPGFESGNLSGLVLHRLRLRRRHHARAHRLLRPQRQRHAVRHRPVHARPSPSQPSTAYTLSGWVRGSYVYLGVPAAPSTWTPRPRAYTKLTVPFTTTAGQTSIQVYLHGWYGTGAYNADDIALDGPRQPAHHHARPPPPRRRRAPPASASPDEARRPRPPPDHAAAGHRPAQARPHRLPPRQLRQRLRLHAHGRHPRRLGHHRPRLRRADQRHLRRHPLQPLLRRRMPGRRVRRRVPRRHQGQAGPGQEGADLHRRRRTARSSSPPPPPATRSSAPSAPSSTGGASTGSTSTSRATRSSLNAGDSDFRNPTTPSWSTSSAP